ncbi:MAG: hypothetical protein ACI8P0_004814, partial [Planctomycetaceae bacterium]
DSAVPPAQLTKRKTSTHDLSVSIPAAGLIAIRFMQALAKPVAH